MLYELGLQFEVVHIRVGLPPVLRTKVLEVLVRHAGHPGLADAVDGNMLAEVERAQHCNHAGGGRAEGLEAIHLGMLVQRGALAVHVHHISGVHEEVLVQHGGHDALLPLYPPHKILDALHVRAYNLGRHPGEHERHIVVQWKVLLVPSAPSALMVHARLGIVGYTICRPSAHPLLEILRGAPVKAEYSLVFVDLCAPLCLAQVPVVAHDRAALELSAVGEDVRGSRRQPLLDAGHMRPPSPVALEVCLRCGLSDEYVLRIAPQRQAQRHLARADAAVGGARFPDVLKPELGPGGRAWDFSRAASIVQLGRRRVPHPLIRFQRKAAQQLGPQPTLLPA
mmetsp:Transcript_44806/g.114554  ORF Transcript_44806/g.114554 Transcript_44806/m.114554 type:complete len:338 (+) Transcript_44806:199-1212(+)